MGRICFMWEQFLLFKNSHKTSRKWSHWECDQFAHLPQAQTAVFIGIVIAKCRHKKELIKLQQMSQHRNTLLMSVNVSFESVKLPLREQIHSCKRSPLWTNSKEIYVSSEPLILSRSSLCLAKLSNASMHLIYGLNAIQRSWNKLPSNTNPLVPVKLPSNFNLPVSV